MEEEGQLSNRRMFADLDGHQPDAICADAEGAVWAGIYNSGEFRVLDGGTTLRLPAPAYPARSGARWGTSFSCLCSSGRMMTSPPVSATGRSLRSMSK
ncbi:SMP-30/gluconolactonase/LRE family protein [Rhizobium leguminosarum]